MKRIEALLPPHRLTPVIHKLDEFLRSGGHSVLDAHGQGHGRGAGGHDAHDAHDVQMYLDRKAVIVICEDADAHTIARLIAATAHSGNQGDGILVTLEKAEVLRLRDVTEAAAPVASTTSGTPESRGDA